MRICAAARGTSLAAVLGMHRLFLSITLVALAACAPGRVSSAVDAHAARLTWSAATPAPLAIDHHVTFAARSGAGTFAYVVGGFADHRPREEAWRAAIAPDGSLGPWTTTSPLPSGRGGSSVAVVDRRIVITGGKVRPGDNGNSTDTFVTTIGVDGALDAWRPSQSLPLPRFHHSAAANGRTIYVTGGLENQAAVAAVFRATLGDDGSLSAWTREADLPRARSHHASFVYEDALYVVGGLDGVPMEDRTELYRDVLRAPLAPDGSVGAWRAVGALDAPVCAHAVTIDRGAMVVIGGVGEIDRSDRVARATIDAKGAIGTWEELTPLPNARGHVHQVPIVDGRLYSIGGSPKEGERTAEAWVGALR
jgi:hypothetical protein